jgi:hypothetical protein
MITHPGIWFQSPATGGVAEVPDTPLRRLRIVFLANSKLIFQFLASFSAETKPFLFLTIVMEDNIT